MMGKIIDRSGQQFGRLKAIKLSGMNNNGSAKWLCVCSCGNTVTVTGSQLGNGSIRSCGCLRNEIAISIGKKNTTHGKSGTLVYRSWCKMLSRCRNKNYAHFKHYGGRGISVCKRWEIFENFYKDMGDPINGYSLDRIDNNGNYEPENCRWATKSEQTRNTRSNRWLEADGKRMVLQEWADLLGVCRSTIYRRLKNYPIAIALTNHKG